MKSSWSDKLKVDWLNRNLDSYEEFGSKFWINEDGEEVARIDEGSSQLTWIEEDKINKEEE